MPRLNFEAVPRAIDANGDPVSGAKMYVYRAGTTAVEDTYSDAEFTTSQANPQTADSAGFFAQTYVKEGDYKVLVTDASDVTIYEADNIAQGVDEALPAIMIAAFGQSNVASSNTQAAGGDLTTDTTILFWSGTAWLTWDPDSGIGVGAPGRNSLLFQAAKEAKRYGYPKVYCVSDGHAGQAISYWTGSGTSSAGYASLKTAMDAAVASPEVQADGAKILRGIIWGQGESDGGSSFDIDSYRTSFDTLKAQWRAESWCADDTPIAALEMPSLASAQTVNRFFVSDMPFDSDPYTVTVKTEGLDDGSDNLHWTGDAMNRIGARAFKLIESRTFQALPKPSLIDSDVVRFRLEDTFGKGFGFSYNATLDQVYMGVMSDASPTSNAVAGITVDVNDMWVRLDPYAYAASTFEFLGGAILKSYTATEFTTATSALNTTDKKEGMVYWDATNNRLAVAQGTAATDDWSYFSAAGTYTPA